MPAVPTVRLGRVGGDNLADLCGAFFLAQPLTQVGRECELLDSS